MADWHSQGPPLAGPAADSVSEMPHSPMIKKSCALEQSPDYHIIYEDDKVNKKNFLHVFSQSIFCTYRRYNGYKLSAVALKNIRLTPTGVLVAVPRCIACKCIIIGSHNQQVQ